MKKTILFAAFVIIAVSCTQTTTEPCPPVREPVGYNNLSEDFTGAVIGNNETVAIWQQYLEYHNDRNFDGIQELDADSIQIYAADGRLVKGAEEHRAQLEAWLATEDVRWKAVWGTSIKSPNDTSDGAFVIAVSDLAVVGEESTKRMNNMFTAWIQGGKVQAFWIYDRQFTEQELTMIEAAESSEWFSDDHQKSRPSNWVGFFMRYFCQYWVWRSSIFALNVPYWIGIMVSK